MQAHRFGEHASNIEARQCCAFLGLLPGTRSAPQHA
jgi:hypothetical protein